MSFKFNKIDIKSFERIWDSAHYDNHIDSWKMPFSQTEENEWSPIYEKALIVWREVIHHGNKIGYIFISPKSDGAAHLGYGVYISHRRNGLSVLMCKQYIDETIPTLSHNINHLLGSILKDNIASKIVLKKLGFHFHKEVIEVHNDAEILYQQYKLSI